MAITPGQQALASDFISSSAGSGSSGQVPKLGSSGRIDNSFVSNLFGDGSDGTVLLDGTNTFAGFMSKSGSTYTLLRDVYATTLTVNTSVILITGNWRIFATVAVTGAGTIKQDGNNGGNNGYQGGQAGGGGAITGYFTTPAGGTGASGNQTGGSSAGGSCVSSPRSTSSRNSFRFTFSP